MIAGRTKRPTAAQLLVERGVDPNQANQDGETALLFAIEAGDPLTVRTLLACGADPRVIAKDGGTVQRSKSSSLTAVSVPSSRYFTITGA